MSHFVSPTTEGEYCALCKGLVRATHKVGEEIPFDDPSKLCRHNFTTYVCCTHFTQLFGQRVYCDGTIPVVDPHFYPMRCIVCGWRGSSEHTDGGLPIADTGDYGELRCPQCGSIKLEDLD
jgi:hypothetical protein